MIKRSQNILVLGTGPSILYNFPKISQYIKKHNPVIIGVNGCLYGLRRIADQIHKVKLPDGRDVEIDTHEMFYPNVLFSFFHSRERITTEGVIRKKSGPDTKLFDRFIMDQKDFIIKQGIQLACPTRKSRKGTHGKVYRQAGWKGYKGYFEHDIFPLGFTTAISSRMSTFNMENFRNYKEWFDKKNRIVFRPKHGGEYVLAWAATSNPKRLAVCGILDFPGLKKHKYNNSKAVYRGWFWSEYHRILPRSFSWSQSLMFKVLRKSMRQSFTDLNFEPWHIKRTSKGRTN